MVIDSTAYTRLNMEEKQRVDAGKVLINHDPVTGRTIIRVLIRCKTQEYQRIRGSTVPLCHDSAKDFR